MSMLETEMLEQNNFRDIMKQQEEQLLGQVWCPVQFKVVVLPICICESCQ